MRRAASAVTLVVASAVLVARPAHADVTKAECLRSNVSAQALRRESKLRAAAEELRVCADPTCPTIVRDDCAQRLDEVDRAQPTITFEVKDASGADVRGASVTVDGTPRAGTLGGTPLLVDPGEHVFVFTAPGALAVSRTLVLTEGVKGRRERVVLTAAPAPAPASGMSTQRVVALGLGGVGIAGLIVGGVFGGLTLSEESAQKSDCSSSTIAGCPQHAAAVSAHGTGTTYGAVSTAGFIAAEGAMLPSR